MKVFEIVQGASGLEALRQVERPDPAPAPGQVVLRVRAASLNYRDLAVLAGAYPGPPAGGNLIPLSDGAGEVVAVGPGVHRAKTGDRVAATFFRGWHDGPPRQPYVALGAGPTDGMLAEYVAVHEGDLVHLPDSLSFAEGACLPCAGVTAWHALMVAGRPVRPGDVVLALGTGGVSMFAVQFAAAAGARVVITSSSDDKLARARAAGASDGINYRATPEWHSEVLKVTGGHGADHVVEVGGVGTLAKSFQSVAYGGKVALIGVLAGFQGDSNPHHLMFRGGSLHGIFVGNRAMFEDMLQAMTVNRITPIIDKVFPFADAPAAYRHQQSGQHLGKVVIALS